MTHPVIDLSHLRAQSRAFLALFHSDGTPRSGRRVCNAWGRGTGKSKFNRVVMYNLVAQLDGVGRSTAAGRMRGVRINMLFPTFKHFTRLGHAQNLLEELEPDGAWECLGAKINKSDWRVTFPGGSYIQLLTAESSNRGARADAAIIDECDEIPLSYYESEIDPWFTEPWSLNLQLLSGTPKRGRYGLLYHAFRIWPRGDVEHAADPNSYSFHATAYDATGDIVSRAKIEGAGRDLGVDSPRFQTEYLCNFDAGEGLVYPHFSEDFHVRYPHPETAWREFIVGVDWGYEHPTVFLVFGLAGHGRDVQIHLLAEYVTTHKVDSELVAAARETDRIYPNAKWYADPSRPDKIETFRRPPQVGPDGYNRGGAGLRIVGADNAILAGIETIADVLAVRERPEPLGQWSQLFIHPEAKHTIHEFGMYRREREGKNADTFREEIIDKDNHCMDAMRYAIHTHLGGPDRRMRTGYEAV